MITAREWTADVLGERYDVLIAALGYESRARFVSSRLASLPDVRIACGFTDRQVHAFAENKAWFESSGFHVTLVPDADLAEWVGTTLEAVDRGSSSHVLKVALDISSLSRFRMATFVDGLRRRAWSRPVAIDFLYAPARFSPPAEFDEPNVHVGPVLPSFAGWTEEPEKSPIAIIGLGYEQDRALGAVEHTQPGQVWTFLPISDVREYDSALQSANATLLEGVRSERQFSYRVEQPFDCFVRLEALAYSCSQHGNTVCFPFGPKIFAVCCLMVASIHENVAVWRVSAGSGAEPLDRVARGDIVGIRMVASASSEEDVEVDVDAALSSTVSEAGV